MEGIIRRNNLENSLEGLRNRSSGLYGWSLLYLDISLNVRF